MHLEGVLVRWLKVSQQLEMFGREDTIRHVTKITAKVLPKPYFNLCIYNLQCSQTP
jgi:hypothetical protein